MRRAFTLHSKTLKHFTSNPKTIPCCPLSDNLKPNNYILSSSPYASNLRFFSSSSENDSSNQTTESKSEPTESKSEPTESKSDPTAGIKDFSNKDLKLLMEGYLNQGKEESLPTVFEAILRRKLFGKQEVTDDKMIDKFEFKPLDNLNLNNQDFEEGLEECLQNHSTDDEIEDLASAGDVVTKRMTKDPYFNMTDHKWDSMVQEAVQSGYIKDPKEVEDQIENMMKLDTLLPDDAKQKIEKKLDEIEDLIERNELTPEEGYDLFKEFEDKLVNQVMGEEEAAQQSDRPDMKKEQDPPGEGPVLRWQSRVVFCPGSDAWHPRNRKVKMAVTVKELGLSKYQYLRLTELVGKRYNSRNDELTLVSERFDHREENRKDCLRTLYALVDEARKADDLVEAARTKYLKENLKSNPEFMEKLRAKLLRTRESNMTSA